MKNLSFVSMVMRSLFSHSPCGGDFAFILYDELSDAGGKPSGVSTDTMAHVCYHAGITKIMVQLARDMHGCQLTLFLKVRAWSLELRGCTTALYKSMSVSETVPGSKQIVKLKFTLNIISSSRIS